MNIPPGHGFAAILPLRSEILEQSPAYTVIAGAWNERWNQNGTSDLSIRIGEEDPMRFTAALTASLFAASLSFASAAAAQTPAGNEPPENPPAQQSQDQQQSVRREFPAPWTARPGIRGRVIMATPGPRAVEERQDAFGGPLRVFSRLEAQLDNPRVRTALGLTDQQVDSLRSVLVDTEIFTIQTGASALVDGIQLKELLRSDHPDRAAVMAKGDRLSQSASELIHHYLDAVLKAKTILTPQQQDMIRMYMENGNRAFGASGFRMNPER
jgi:Spy/CpxP family protein refolding chaperone